LSRTRRAIMTRSSWATIAFTFQGNWSTATAWQKPSRQVIPRLLRAPQSARSASPVWMGSRGSGGKDLVGTVVGGLLLKTSTRPFSMCA
jgi:hypothetical protein